MISDIHTHILPGVDDGAGNVNESAGLLKAMADEGITSVVATPHFYADMSSGPKEHTKRIKDSFESIKGIIPSDIENIVIGHEVHYFSGISRCEEIKELTIGKSNYMLVELPFSGITPGVVSEITDLSLNLNIKVILAHIERYSFSPLFNEILDVIEDDFAVGQLNCDTLLDKRGKKIGTNLIKDGYVSVIATDTHSLEKRPPRMREALNCVAGKLGSDYKRMLIENSNNLFAEIEGHL